MSLNAPQQCVWKMLAAAKLARVATDQAVIVLAVLHSSSGARLMQLFCSTSSRATFRRDDDGISPGLKFARESWRSGGAAGL